MKPPVPVRARVRDGRRGLLLGLLIALLLLRATRALLSTAFYESLATLRLNTTALWTLALLAPLAAAILPARALAPAIGLAGIATAALPFARFSENYLPLSALAVAAALVALALHARAPLAGVGLVAGLVVDGALLLVGDPLDPAHAPIVAALTLAATIAALALARGMEAPRPASTLASAAHAAGLALLVAVEIAFLASPYAAARALDLPAWGAALASLGALLAGAALPLHPRRWVAALVLLAFADLALVRSPLVGASLVVAQLALGAAGARLAPAIGSRAGAAAFGLVLAPIVFVLLFFRDPLGIPEWGAIVPLLALAALALAWRARALSERPRRAAIVPAVALVALVLAASLPVPIAAPGEGPGFTLVTYNVHQGFGNRGALDPQIYVDILRALDPDVVVLQESDTARLSSGGLDMVQHLREALHMRATFGQTGVAILSRFPFAEDAPGVPEEVWSLEAAIDVRGTIVHVHGVHLARNPAARAEQAREIVAAADARPGPRVVAGDLNLFRGFDREPAYGTLTQRFDDAWVEAGHARDDPAGRTIGARNPRWRVDLVLVEGLVVDDARVELTPATRSASDHLPVVTRLRVP